MALDQRKDEVRTAFNKESRDNYPGNKPYTGKYWEKAAAEHRAGKASKNLTKVRIDNLKKAQGRIENNSRNLEEKQQDFQRRVGANPQHNMRGGPARRAPLTEQQQREQRILEAKAAQHKILSDKMAKDAYDNRSLSNSFNKEASLKGRFNQKSKGIER